MGKWSLLQSSEATLPLASAVPGQYRAQEAQTSRDRKAVTGEGVAHRKHGRWLAIVTAEIRSHTALSDAV